MDVNQMLRDARTERVDLEKRLGAVNKVIAALEGMAEPELSKTKPVENATHETSYALYPRPKDAVLQAIHQLAPGRPVEPREVTAIVREIGLFNPDLKSGASAYTTALSRLADEPDSEIHRQGDFYVFRPVSQEVLHEADTADGGYGGQI